MGYEFKLSTGYKNLKQEINIITSPLPVETLGTGRSIDKTAQKGTIYNPEYMGLLPEEKVKTYSKKKLLTTR